VRAIAAGAGAFALVTAGWALWGYLTPGDYFANGSTLLWPSLVVALVIGSALGWSFSPMRVARTMLVIGVVASLAFWSFVPNAWWAHWPSLNAPHSP